MTSKTIKVQDGGQRGTTVFKRPCHMNGDFLVYLKKQLRGEMSQSVRGHNAAIAMAMNAQLDAWFEEQKLFLRRLKRSQGKVYKTMLMIDREKKKLSRKAKRENGSRETENQEEGRDEQEAPNGDEPGGEGGPIQGGAEAIDGASAGGAIPGIKVFQPLPDIVVEQKYGEPVKMYLEAEKPQTDVLSSSNHVEDKGIDAKPLVLPPKDFKTPKKKKTSTTRSRALEITKPLNLPMIREMTKETSTVTVDIDFVKQAQLRNADSLETLGTTSMGASGDAGKRNTNGKLENSTEYTESVGGNSLASTDITFSKKSLPPIQGSPTKRYRTTQSLDSAAGMSEMSLGAEAASMAEDTSRSDDLSSKTYPKKQLSMVEQKRLAQMEREEARRKVLENEPIVRYRKDGRGRYVMDSLPFKRSQFTIPTNREQRIRTQLLESQRQALDNHRSKMTSFFSRLDKQKQEEWKSKPPPLKEEPPKEIDPGSRELGGQLTAFVSAFVHLPYGDDIDPNSAEALHHCRYIRTYTPGAAMDSDGRHSSWSVSTTA